MHKLSFTVLALAWLPGCADYAEPLPYDADYGTIEPVYDTGAPAEVEPGELVENPWVAAAEQAVSTFSADVDTGSYTLTRRAILEDQPVEAGSVRIEEFLNYFDYDTEPPTGDLPFAVALERGPSTFGPSEDIQLLRIGIQAEEIPLAERDPVNLVFLLDVSGSMNQPDKLGLVKFSMKQLVDKLQPDDTLGIVVYAGSDGVVLEPTPVREKSAILEALDKLESGGSTNGQAGIERAYELAQRAFRSDGVNRVVLCSDGDMNVGLTGNRLVRYVSGFRDQGIYLTTLGFGTGNYQDEQMEQLANDTDGNYAYIDSKNEALRVLGEKLVSTLQVVAKDVKLQMRFDPSVVERWRLVGYENRLLDADDFEDDAVDAGDIGAGHHVTALYELDLVDGAAGAPGELAIRFKPPEGGESTEHLWAVPETPVPLESTSADFRFAAGVAEMAEILRGSMHSEGERWSDVTQLVEEARPMGERDVVEAELLSLIQRVRTP